MSRSTHGPRSTRTRLEIADKQRQALELRKAGLSLEEIAQRVGYRDKSGAYRAVMAALRRTLQEPADAVRKMELERLDALLQSVWSIVAAPEPADPEAPPPYSAAERLAAVDRALRIMDQRAKYLGLAAPQRVVVFDWRREALERGLDPAQLMETVVQQLALVAAGGGQPAVGRLEGGEAPLALGNASVRVLPETVPG